MVGAYTRAVDVVINSYPLCQIVRAAIPALDPLRGSLSAYLALLSFADSWGGGNLLCCRWAVGVLGLLGFVIFIVVYVLGTLDREGFILFEPLYFSLTERGAGYLCGGLERYWSLLNCVCRGTVLFGRLLAE